MKKSVGIVIAIIVTVLTMGTAFAIQHHVSQSQPVTEQKQTMTSSSSKEEAANQASSSSKKHAVAVSSSKKKAEKKHSTSSERKTSSAKKTVSSESKTVANKSKSPKKDTKSASSERKATMAKSTTTTTATKESTAKQTNQITVHLTVSGYKKTFFKGNVKVSSKANAFTVLQASKLKIDYQNGVVVYVSGVNGLSENDIKTGSGWKYRVNGKFIDAAANQKRIHNHDSVHWYFTTEGY